MRLLPPELLDSLEKISNFDLQAFVDVHEAGETLTCVRINPRKKVAHDEHLRISEPVPWSSGGYYLLERPVFTLDPLFHAGAYYVQEASSMFLEEALKQTVDLSQPVRILDLCAAPGGKSTLIQSLAHHDSLLVSNEVIKSRVNVLQENMIKWGGKNVVITNNDAKDFARLENYFDAMVVDAPCSGSGLFRKDARAISEWSPQNVALCSQRQQRILADAIPSLKRNGVLIYSTCSYSAEEDEEILDWLNDSFEFESLQLRVNPSWGIVESISSKNHCYGYRFYPGRVKGEGFFIAALRKKDGDDEFNESRKIIVDYASKKDMEMVKHWIRMEAEMSVIKHAGQLLAIPIHAGPDVSILQKNLYLKQAGVTIGKLASNELIPDHALAMSDFVSTSIVTVSLNKETALQYLRKGEVFIDVGQRGWALVSYCGINLGWIKHLGNRINNYYPKDWRILMQ
jgi:16S rRNA C967 or C1407 C5-methylase (RsmB/RsmF family)/NOL1/NOP2/fmu family ribosome biogenesis protein